MSSEVMGFVWGAVLVGAQVVVIYGLAKLLSTMTDRILPDKKEF